MAKAKLETDDNGGMSVVVISWAEPQEVYSIDFLEMAGISEEAMPDGSAEPDYDLMEEMVYERLDDVFNPESLFTQNDLRKAVRQQIHPGPIYAGEPVTFEI